MACASYAGALGWSSPGNSIGSANFVPDYYGHELASRSNVIFVSVNYRLGPFGWFTHPALREGAQDPADRSGNYGTLDILQALRWIGENIENFGGDTERIIITGESSGGRNILSMVASPLAKGLFSHAMVQSGSRGRRGVADGDALTDRILTELAPGSMTAKEARAYLYGKSAKEIMGALTPGTTGMTGVPAIFPDGFVIPKVGFQVFETGEYANKVPIIFGNNKEELKLFLSFSRDLSWKSDLYQAVAKYGSQRWKADAVDSIARAMSLHLDQPPVYAYRFDWGAPNENGDSPLPGNWGARLGSFHSLEIPFFLGTDTIDGLCKRNCLTISTNSPSGSWTEMGGSISKVAAASSADAV